MSALSRQLIAVFVFTLCVGWLPIAAHAETVLTLHATINTFPDRDVTVTVDADGTVATEVEWAPDPDDMHLPDGMVPDGATVKEIELKGQGENGMFETEAALKHAVALAIASYLVVEGLRLLAEEAESYPPTYSQ